MLKWHYIVCVVQHMFTTSLVGAVSAMWKQYASLVIYVGYLLSIFQCNGIYLLSSLILPVGSVGDTRVQDNLQKNALRALRFVVCAC